MSPLNQVILIDDDEINNFVCESIIKSHNFAKEVLSFERAEDAILFLKQLAKLEDQARFPDLIFLDINMPGMDGWSFIEEYRGLPQQLTEHCSLFMLSSAVDRKDIMSAKNLAEVKEFFSKPLSPEILDFIKEEYVLN